MSEFQQTMSGLMTGALLFLFIGICIWSWSSKRKDSFDRMANLPLEDGSIDGNNNNTNANAESKEIKDKRKSKINIGTVIDFPLGQSSCSEKISQAKKALDAGAKELDFVCDYNMFKRNGLDVFDDSIIKINNDGKITPMGFALSKFRVLEPNSARSLIASHFYGCSRSVCDIIALSITAEGRIDSSKFIASEHVKPIADPTVKEPAKDELTLDDIFGPETSTIKPGTNK